MQELRKKAAQVIFPRLGSNMPPPVRVSEDIDRFRVLQERLQFGGLVLFNGHKDDTPELLANLQGISEEPILVASDIERGAGQQIEGATRFPHAAACGKAGDEAVSLFARVTAREALACGIHIGFAPVADVNSNPRNPIIGIRSFGSEPAEVSRHAANYIATCREEGLLTTAKHFPGHGDTETDSHAELPIVAKSLEAFDRTERPPFTAAIDAGTDLIMTAHIAFPALDPSLRAATLSAPILEKLLRGRMGFEGAIVSDSLIMKAVQAGEDGAAAYAAALLDAGLDILLDPPDPEALLEGIVRAVAEGLLSEKRLDQAVSRVRRMKSGLIGRFGQEVFHHPEKIWPAHDVGCREHVEAAREIAIRAIRKVHGSSTFSGSQGGLAVFATPFRTRLDPDEAPIRGSLLRAFPGLTYVEIDADTPEEILSHFFSLSKEAVEVLIMVVSRPAAWHRYGLPERLAGFVEEVTRTSKTTLVSLGDPHVLDSFPQAAAGICTFSDVPVSQQALVSYLDKNR